MAKVKKTGKQKKLDHLQNSECLLSIVPGEEVPKLVHIEFHGSLAALPSLKNATIRSRKNPLSHFYSSDFTAKVQAMDNLFEAALAEQGLVSLRFGSELVSVLVIAGDRSRDFDVDNVVQTVRDWLEPKVKFKGGAKKTRGWGIGLVNDDSQITSYGVHSYQTECARPYTTIIIKPWSEVRANALEFIAGHSIG